MSFTSYQVDNDKKFRDALKSISKASQDLRIPFGLILRDFYRSEKAIFQLKSPGQYPDLGGLNPTKQVGKTGKTRREVAKARKMKEVGFVYPLLVGVSGGLAASLLSASADGSIAQINKLSLIWGSSNPALIYHQSDRARKKIPQRKVLFIGPEAPRFASSDQMGRLQRWLGYLNDHMTNIIKGVTNG